MFLLIFYFIFISLFSVAPFLGKLALLIVNLFISDPIPYIDEIIMCVSTLRHLSVLIDVWENHKKLLILGVFVGICLLIIIFW